MKYQWPFQLVFEKLLDESTSRTRRNRKDKSHRLEDTFQRHLDGILDRQHLETARKCKKLVKKQLTSRTGLSSLDHQMLENQRKRKKTAEKQIKTNSGISPEEQAMLKSPPKRKEAIKKILMVN